MNPVEVLRQARDLWLAHPTREEFAKDADGNVVEPMDPTAVCWCVYGALAKVIRVSEVAHALGCESAAALRKSVPDKLLTTANDDGTLTREHWDIAIRSLGGEPYPDTDCPSS